MTPVNTRQAIQITIDSGKAISLAYLGDLTDAEMMHRPDPAANHIKWQLGHLIASEHEMVEKALPGSMPPLPEGFAERYSKTACSVDDPTAFDSKQELLRVMEQQREGTLKALHSLSDDDLDGPAPEKFHAYAPTVAVLFAVQGTHWLMHAGQWAVIRRRLGRPPLF